MRMVNLYVSRVGHGPHGLGHSYRGGDGVRHGGRRRGACWRMCYDSWQEEQEEQEAWRIREVGGFKR